MLAIGEDLRRGERELVCVEALCRLRPCLIRAIRHIVAHITHHVPDIHIQWATVSMGDRVVGLLDGRDVYADGHGGYAVKVKGEMRPLPSSAHDKTIMFADVLSHGATLRPQGANSNTSSDGNSHEGFVRIPSGAYHKVVQEGTGRVPTATDRVKYNHISWSDAFDGQNKAYEERGRVNRVSDWVLWEREALLSMPEGEVRQIIVPATHGAYVQLHLISIE
ncbi:unnamed protein product [Vitrella brassicaformis CCMP3155]|uniref:Uncharacterized protein n=1 Tax=Vitrella brassicaformis (strain CCMP3155) TaxID=1169540 RepID=A0A0G4H4U7_VITBC|nr:unnamed protein product [Vitrella brassicaformis CCMP3155]|eukprot:CEM38808.1 unnamed protein product [Vitrella brassicaformis CCMP3155]